MGRSPSNTVRTRRVLATITSKEEDEFLYSYITDMGYDSALFGLSDTEQDNEWTWVTGETLLMKTGHQGNLTIKGGYEHYGMYYEKNKDGSGTTAVEKHVPSYVNGGTIKQMTSLLQKFGKILSPQENIWNTQKAGKNSLECRYPQQNMLFWTLTAMVGELILSRVSTRFS